MYVKIRQFIFKKCLSSRPSVRQYKPIVQYSRISTVLNILQIDIYFHPCHLSDHSPTLLSTTSKMSSISQYFLTYSHPLHQIPQYKLLPDVFQHKPIHTQTHDPFPFFPSISSASNISIRLELLIRCLILF